MQAIRNLLPAALPDSTKPAEVSRPASVETPQRVESRRVTLLFAVLEIHFGGRWTSRFCGLSEAEAVAAMRRTKAEWRGTSMT